MFAGVVSKKALRRLSGSSQQALRRLSAQESLRKLSADSQETLSKHSGDDFSEPAGCRVGPLPPALRRTRKLPLVKLSGNSQRALKKLSSNS